MKELTQQLEKSIGKKITDLNTSKIIIARLTIERIGEIDQNAWWQSRILSDHGHKKMKELFPKTQTQAQINLAFEIGKKKEKELIQEKEYISLYNLEIRTEKLIQAIIKTTDPEELKKILEQIKNITSTNMETDLEKKEQEKIKTLRGLNKENPGAFQIEEITFEELSEEKINKIIEKLIYAWSLNKKGELQTPYLKIK